jgi:hypothetical protein
VLVNVQTLNYLSLSKDYVVNSTHTTADVPISISLKFIGKHVKLPIIMTILIAYLLGLHEISWNRSFDDVLIYDVNFFSMNTSAL